MDADADDADIDGHVEADPPSLKSTHLDRREGSGAESSLSFGLHATPRPECHGRMLVAPQMHVTNDAACRRHRGAVCCRVCDAMSSHAMPCAFNSGRISPAPYPPHPTVTEIELSLAFLSFPFLRLAQLSFATISCRRTTVLSTASY